MAGDPAVCDHQFFLKGLSWNLGEGWVCLG